MYYTHTHTYINSNLQMRFLKTIITAKKGSLMNVYKMKDPH